MMFPPLLFELSKIIDKGSCLAGCQHDIDFFAIVMLEYAFFHLFNGDSVFGCLFLPLFLRKFDEGGGVSDRFLDIAGFKKLANVTPAKIGCLENQLADQRVYNATSTAAIGCIQSQIAQLMSLTKLVVPNGSVCPGWGNVTITPAAAPAA
jgi:hypothetical protein